MKKQCSTCKQELPLTLFSKNKSRPDGFQYSCKRCLKIVQNKTNRRTEHKKRNLELRMKRWWEVMAFDPEALVQELIEEFEEDAS